MGYSWRSFDSVGVNVCVFKLRLPKYIYGINEQIMIMVVDYNGK